MKNNLRKQLTEAIEHNTFANGSFNVVGINTAVTACQRIIKKDRKSHTMAFFRFTSKYCVCVSDNPTQTFKTINDKYKNRYTHEELYEYFVKNILTKPELYPDVFQTKVKKVSLKALAKKKALTKVRAKVNNVECRRPNPIITIPNYYKTNK